MLGRQIWVIFLAFTSVDLAVAQVDDSFDQPVLNAIWEGDRTDFIITDNGELRLSQDQAGASRLFTEIQPSRNFSWEWTSRLEFAPSNSNRLQVALISDTSFVNGIFIQIGVSGDEDAVQVLSRVDKDTEILAEGVMGDVAENPHLAFDVQLEDNVLSVAYTNVDDLTTGSLEVTLPEVNIIGPIVFGFRCAYTSTRSDRFFFDDILVGSTVPDQDPPQIILTRIMEDKIIIDFDESIDANSVQIGSSVVVTPSPADIQVRVAARRLELNGDYVSGVPYEVDLVGIADLSGNLLDTSVQLTRFGSPGPGDLLIHEILFNPIGDGADYLEVINVSDRVIDLNGLTIRNAANGDQKVIGSSLLIKDGELIVFTDDPDQVRRDYPIHDPSAFVPLELPRFSNDDGTVELIMADQLVDRFSYDERLHHPLIDIEDGVSLERISVDVPTDDGTNWTSASSDVHFGTPGSPNSASVRGGQNRFSTNAKTFVASSGDDLQITYVLDRPGYTGAITIFDDRGRKRTDLTPNQLFGTEGELMWDGRCANTECEEGIYILQIQLVHPDGTRWSTRKTVGLARR